MQAEDVAQRLIEVMSQPFALDGHLVTMGTSIGVAVTCEEELPDPELLQRRADVALYSAKAAGRGGWRVFDESMRAGEVQRGEAAD
jgi:GGDEF domain-containing protein